MRTSRGPPQGPRGNPLKRGLLGVGLLAVLAFLFLRRLFDTATPTPQGAPEWTTPSGMVRVDVSGAKPRIGSDAAEVERLVGKRRDSPAPALVRDAGARGGAPSLLPRPVRGHERAVQALPRPDGQVELRDRLLPQDRNLRTGRTSRRSRPTTRTATPRRPRRRRTSTGGARSTSSTGPPCGPRSPT